MQLAVADILAFLSAHFGEDFESYSRSLAVKRIRERVAQLGLSAPSTYRDLLRRDPAEAEVLARMLRVRFSSFFRDSLEFELLGSLVVPALLQECTGFFRGWSAACASGEEAYSLAIILDEAMQPRESRVQVQIFATDIAREALEEARLGRYRPESVAGVTLKRLESYFTPAPSGYQVTERLRDVVTCYRYDLLDRRTYVPPESLYGGFDLVLCRNFLMYLEPRACARVFDKLFRALNPGGVLMLGKAESVPERYQPELERVVALGNLYRKKTGGRRG